MQQHDDNNARTRPQHLRSPIRLLLQCMRRLNAIITATAHLAWMATCQQLCTRSVILALIVSLLTLCAPSFWCPRFWTGREDHSCATKAVCLILVCGRASKFEVLSGNNSRTSADQGSFVGPGRGHGKSLCHVLPQRGKPRQVDEVQGQSSASPPNTARIHSRIRVRTGRPTSPRARSRHLSDQHRQVLPHCTRPRSQHDRHQRNDHRVASCVASIRTLRSRFINSSCAALIGIPLYMCDV
jgi:hypothetical protein